MMNKHNFSFGFLVLFLLIALGGGFLGGVAATGIIAPNMVGGDIKSEVITEKTNYIEESSIIDVAEKLNPSVVSIVVSKDLPIYRNQFFGFNDLFNDPFFNFPFQVPQQQQNQGEPQYEHRKVGGGTGFIVSEEGLIATNRHVVADEEAEYTVVMNDGTEYPAQVLARDQFNDIAVIKLTPKEGEDLPELTPVELGDSDQLKVGQRVIAIGNALSEYENTVTTGVVSAKGRSITAGSIQGSESLINLIQTDAAINPGNSGGPLVNLEGQVIGINTAIAAGAQGIGFAIPVNDVLRVIDSVKEHGKIIRPYLGVRFMMLDEAKAKELQIDVEGGALLVGKEEEGEFAVIPGSPADKAGLKIKDVILEVNGEKVTLDRPLNTIIAQKDPDEEITLKIWRSGKEMEIKVILAEAK